MATGHGVPESPGDRTSTAKSGAHTGASAPNRDSPSVHPARVADPTARRRLPARIVSRKNSRPPPDVTRSEATLRWDKLIDNQSHEYKNPRPHRGAAAGRRAACRATPARSLPPTRTRNSRKKPAARRDHGDTPAPGGNECTPAWRMGGSAASAAATGSVRGEFFPARADHAQSARPESHRRTAKADRRNNPEDAAAIDRTSVAARGGAGDDAGPAAGRAAGRKADLVLSRRRGNKGLLFLQPP